MMWLVRPHQDFMTVERISIELTNRCGKHCAFCYNGSHAGGDTHWTPQEIITFIKSCAERGTQAVSFGGGEPLEYPHLFDVLQALKGVLFRSVTSNGLLLRGTVLEGLVKAAPDKVHLSIHFPENDREVERVIAQVTILADAGIPSGVNLLVAREYLAAAATVAAKLHDAGIENDRIIYLPMRMGDTPTPQEVARVAGGKPFQSMSCLVNCHASDRFCAIGWNKQVAWCSYTRARRPLPELTARGLEAALSDLPLLFCG